jgi:hypothetical protein
MDNLCVSSGIITLIVSYHYANYTTLDKHVSIVAVYSVNMS